MKKVGINIKPAGLFLQLVFLLGFLSAGGQINNNDPLYNSGASPEQLRSVSEMDVEEYKKDKKFEYANDPAYWVKENIPAEANTRDELNISAGMLFFKRILFLLLFIGLGILLLWLIFSRGIKLFPGKKKNAGINPGHQSEELDFEGLDHKIQRAVLDADYRMAVRFLYLKTIKGLGEKQMIPYSGSVTDGDFENSLAKTVYASDFRYLRKVYDYVWYGEFNINADQFESINHRFKIFYSSI